MKNKIKIKDISFSGFALSLIEQTLKDIDKLQRQVELLSGKYRKRVEKPVYMHKRKKSWIDRKRLRKDVREILQHKYN